MTTYYELEENTVLTEVERMELAEAKKKPVVYDDDSPEMDDEMENLFIEARRKNPLKEKPITVLVSAGTIDCAVKKFGSDYQLALGRLLDKLLLDQAVL